jgi:hypothetical protein
MASESCNYEKRCESQKVGAVAQKIRYKYMYKRCENVALAGFGRVNFNSMPVTLYPNLLYTPLSISVDNPHRETQSDVGLIL